MLWYLWTGPLSPLFGKDRMATFETYFLADHATHKETKDPYFCLDPRRRLLRQGLRRARRRPRRAGSSSTATSP